MEKIYVTMLGRFDMLVGDSSVLPHIGKSAKSIQLLKYFLLSRGKPLPVSDLIERFWPEPGSGNPESALKTMVSRMRMSLAKASPVLKGCILSEQKTYRWNPQIVYELDLLLFEELYHELEKEEGFIASSRDKYMRLIQLYSGDLSYSTVDEEWLASRSMYLHHLYLKMVGRFLNLLRREKDFETIIHVCRIALDIDAFDERLNLELMSALKEDGQSSAALMQYRHVTSVYYKYLGIEPSEKILDLYKSLIEAEMAAEEDLNSIREDLTSSVPQEMTAMVCHYAVFKDIYQLQLRCLDRQKRQIFLALITMSQALNEPVQPLLMDAIMRQVLEILQKCLRKGDTITRYSFTQYAVLLPAFSGENNSVMIDRIRQMFYRSYSDNRFKISFQFGRLN